jgi:hypothetical protein
MKARSRLQLLSDSDGARSIAALMRAVEDHIADCRCAICCLLAGDVSVDVFLKHPELGSVARRFVERRFPF